MTSYIRRIALLRVREASNKSSRLVHTKSPWSKQKHRNEWNTKTSKNHTTTLSTVATDDEFDEEVERFTAECMSQLLPRYAHYLQSSHSEYPPRPSVLQDDFYNDDGDIIEEYYQLSQDEPRDDSVQDELPYRSRSPYTRLSQFDPQSPPESDDPYDLQMWLETASQRECVERYQKVIEDARERKDYASLSMVQKQIVHWYKPLKEVITKRQKDYILKEGETGQASKRYGPYLCALPPEKLAIITAHEAVLSSLLGSNRDIHGVPFVSIAERIGEAVEEEILIHRALYKRFREKQQEARRKGLEMDDGDSDDNFDETAPSEEAKQIAESLVEQDPQLQNTLEATFKWAYASSHLRSYLDEISKMQPTAKKRRVVAYAVRKAREILENDEKWSTDDKIHLGAALFQAILETATVDVAGRSENAFVYEKRWMPKGKTQSFVSVHSNLYNMIVNDKFDSLGAVTTRYKPMIVPPQLWTSPNEGGYLWLKSDLMRYHGSNTQREALSNAELSTVFDGLNALGRVPWKINERILGIAQQCWENGIALGDIPTQADHEIPDEPQRPERPYFPAEPGTQAFEEYRERYHAYKEAFYKRRRLIQKNMDLRSMRCSTILKLDQAEKFKDFDQIYFPFNIDFRGRAYPVPPHLSNVGSDLCRGLLKFAEAKPLGKNGLYWLKVHLANFAGKDKMTFDDRAKFVDDNLDKVRASATDPFGGERWWMSLEDPFQGLATCFEIIGAMDSGNPETYACSLPVHMDGSCNGLQHYAALGRDRVGGKAVNLCAYDEPQDVYVGVMNEVIRRVAEDAERAIDFDTSNPDSLSLDQKKALSINRAAKLVNGLIDRGVVKRTVMTSVYGVTYIGARKQIQEKIEEKLEQQGRDVDAMSTEVFSACGYLARVTMSVMGELFQGAKGTMNWLTTCARMITQHGYPVAWISPIGVPTVQPYRQKKTATLVTLMQTVTIAKETDGLPIHKSRQVTAFPPNYVHSLDSSHMLLTAIEMDRRGLTFSAVHDSFWTHPCDIDEMNGALRDVFVHLYEQPLLERLKRTWEMRYPDLTFPDLPKRGELDLHEVKNAKYFFQ